MSIIPSGTDDVRSMYASSASDYAQLMTEEINLPVYAATFSRLKSSIEDIPGCIIDTACGSGDMLSLYKDQFNHERSLMGFDLSPEMVSLAQKKLGSGAVVKEGDMRSIPTVADNSASAVINFYAIHHISVDDLRIALKEWHRVLKVGGNLVLAGWEGEGAIDYGTHSDIVAVCYRQKELEGLLEEAGFSVSRSVVEEVADMGMNGVYIDAVKQV